MAEGVGFEPTKELPLRWFSRPVLSTAQPPLQIANYKLFYIFILEKTTFIYCTASVKIIFNVLL